MLFNALCRTSLFCSLVGFFLLLPASGQRIKPYQDPAAAPAPPQATTQPAPGALGDIARSLREKERKKVKVTPEEAKEIFKAVDELTDFASTDSGMAMRARVKRQLVGQAEVEQMARTRNESAEEKQERQRGMLAMKKLGLLPRDFDIEGFSSELMGESVAGFYDAKTKMVTLLNWVPLEEQKSVLAHELTHALQDQNYDLLNWHKQRKTNPADPKSVVGSETDEGESSIAGRSVTEGQAMVVMMDYLLTPLHTDLAHQPGLIEAVQERVSYGSEGPVLHRAPLAIREGMNFPYRDGLNFEIALLQKGRAAAFANALLHPPQLTYEILHPNAYINHEKIVPVRIPDLRAALGDTVRVQDSGVIGELDTRVFIRQYDSNWLAKELAKSWRGASYVTVARSPEGQPSTTNDVAMIYVSRWQSEDAAERFATFYAGAVAKRYRNAAVVADWKPVAGKSGQPVSATQVMTEEGPVMVEVWPGNMVIVTESFEPDAAARVRDAVLTARPATRTAVNQTDLTLRLAGSPELGPLRHALHENAMRAIVDVARQAMTH